MTPPGSAKSAGPIEFGRLALPLGSLVTLVTMAVGGAIYAADLRSSIRSAVEDLNEIKVELKQVRVQLGDQSGDLKMLRQDGINTTTHLERLEKELHDLRERVRKVELQLSK